ncbi:MAG: FliM/FliN family flagellar motor C-terminal domain-containing protein [Deltaproteobacteria bacterium]|jgi:flagellar motor switch/type III secretory pathway protein FliN|nr:FliM/FliN family flagellar motor C-terminal domain-containing protein [Deltaproteobacteria bacterium]
MFTEEIQSLLKTPETSLDVQTIRVGAGKEKTFFSGEQVRLLDDLKLTLGVQIGGLSVTAHQLLDLSPNQFFEFEINPHTSLSLFVEGEKIATAKFIAINDKLGIEIMEVK